MLRRIPKVMENVVMHTGNILSINEVKRKAGQSSTEELLESLKFVRNERYKLTWGETSGKLVVNEVADYSSMNLSVPDKRKELKVSVKIFVPDLDGEKIKDSLNAAFKSLHTPYIESVVLALRGGEPFPTELVKKAWLVLEDFVLNKHVVSIGVSDVEADPFVELYQWAKIKPGIVQINLSQCCVVPPALQEFTKEHDVQLLTHSDPPEILPETVVKTDLLGLQEEDSTAYLTFSWAIRYQVHIKCRGVLSSKGYIVCLQK